MLLILIGGVGFFTYNLGQKNQENITKSAKTPTTVSTNNQEVTPTIEISKDLGIKINENTLSYAKPGEKIVLKYRNKIYDDSNQLSMEGKDLNDTSSYNWVGIIDTPSDVSAGEFMLDEVFGFMPTSDNNKFAFVMRWGVKTGDSVKTSYYVYYYDLLKKADKLTLVKKFDESSEGSYKVAKLDKFDKTGKYLSLNMYGCWNCGGHKPETMLVNLETMKMENIGKTSYFIWKENGAYEFKEYKVIPCDGESMGECSEKPENLPLKTGQF